MDFDARKARLTPNSADYQRIHRWVVRQAGKAVVCVNGCFAKKYEWSNISRDYLQDMSDWEQVCRKCHKNRDKTTPEGLRRISEANRRNSIGNNSHNIPIMKIDGDGGVERFTSARQANKATGISYKNISNVLRGWSKTAGGYSWRYVR